MKDYEKFLTSDEEARRMTAKLFYELFFEQIDRLSEPEVKKLYKQFTEPFDKQYGADNTPLRMMYTGFLMGMITEAEIILNARRTPEK